ncbi:tRNA pseudouridine synthase B [Methanimicrococcus hongohii]|uniref:Probable tRNA pseudouridine synthase B n=1 Tax=Methanimicrococcus hongohii TaxID=3028295 RepID=A0AA96V2D9_9EURY|nr:RNA-guided pseudouridylation complex pseudouridine synthase subunit Cbf5 [Methanimicrococcus sp. Hf6]WNY24075.1 tRNA pseudouridine synthase B [Methanimicrococcus sp. Hf6]
MKKQKGKEKKAESELYRNDWFFADSGEFVTLSEISTDGKYGTFPSDRPIEEYINKGVVVLNKPAGPTSHEVAAFVRDILEVTVAGHSGSLDPGVTGIQPVMIGKATRAVAALRLSGKEYICLMKLQRSVPEKLIRSTVSEFVGNVYQMPPVRSAVKRQLRLRHIYYIDVLEIQDTYVLMRVGCEAGTYIRKLCHDLGLALGVGAQMQELVRSKAGPFTDSRPVTLQELKDAYVIWKENGDESLLRELILPMESAFSQLPRFVVRDSAVDALCSGAFLARPGIVGYSTNLKKGDLTAVFSQKGEIISLSIALMSPEEIAENVCGFAAKPKAVLMEKGIYPAVWKNRSARENCPISSVEE